MPKFRVNFTDNHLKALIAVSRLVNATSQAIAYSQNMPERRNYWKRYLNDLDDAGLRTSKIINSTARTGRSGARLGTLYALKPAGAQALAEATGMDENEIFVPAGGIRATSPFQYPHRAEFIELMACFLGYEKASGGQFEVLELHPYFRQEGANRLGTGKAVTTVTVKGSFKSPILVPDGIMRFRVGDTVRLAAIELHRTTDTLAIIEQLRKHAAAIEDGLYQKAFHHKGANHVLSIHRDAARLKNVCDRIRGVEFVGFYRYEAGYHFATFDDVITQGVGGVFWGLSGVRRTLFTQNNAT
jgi:hypothetical protein